jgi:hypothetical protein
MICEKCGLPVEIDCGKHAGNKPAGIDQKSWDMGFGIAVWIAFHRPEGTLGDAEHLAKFLAKHYPGSPK